MLRYSEESSADILKGFECGIQVMDEFIRGPLKDFLKDDPRYQLFVARDDKNGIVAMFVISTGAFVKQGDGFEDLPPGKPWSYFDEDLQIRNGSRYPTVEIDYLAVRKDLREKGYGTEILGKIMETAKQRGCFFLTVDAYRRSDTACADAAKRIQRKHAVVRRLTGFDVQFFREFVNNLLRALDVTCRTQAAADDIFSLRSEREEGIESNNSVDLSYRNTGFL